MYLPGHLESKSSNFLCLLFVSLTILRLTLCESITKLSSSMNISFVLHKGTCNLLTQKEKMRKGAPIFTTSSYYVVVKMGEDWLSITQWS